MSLEDAIVANTAAIHELIVAFKTGLPAAVAPDSPGVSAAGAANSDEKPRRGRKPAGGGANTPAPAETPAETPAGTPKPVIVTYEQAARAVTSLIQRKGKPVAIALLSAFGAQKLPEVKPERFAEVVKACEAEV